MLMSDALLDIPTLSAHAASFLLLLTCELLEGFVLCCSADSVHIAGLSITSGYHGLSQPSTPFHAEAE